MTGPQHDANCEGQEGHYIPLSPEDPGFAERGLIVDTAPDLVRSSARLIGLGAICDLRSTSEDDRSQSFSVSEFALLDDGRRLILHSERGFTTGWGQGVAGPLAGNVSMDSLRRDVLNVVLPDVDDGEEHPYSWLADLVSAHGLTVSADDLRGLPYEVVFTDRVKRWASDESHSP